MRMAGLGILIKIRLKKIICLIGSRTRGHPVCSIVPQSLRYSVPPQYNHRQWRVSSLADLGYRVCLYIIYCYACDHCVTRNIFKNLTENSVFLLSEYILQGNVQHGFNLPPNYRKNKLDINSLYKILKSRSVEAHPVSYAVGTNG
jgi:hypothetical protein